ncbi:hybrid sensor histidine kinase/response regulator [Oceanicoccus sagamiensis]|uniref:histidine kinase n=1 Tax=Oceanicoccus sagamiensis TaxID=716816 RepID=A0A1X9NCT2_9GAMM|nr:hybrid sensor histidine kinase/response regulator [Oceanicoccus sagamiensis]ARN74232.1 hypothetical protein BST96_08925 [Oceanicoccus sagamiensis]
MYTLLSTLLISLVLAGLTPSLWAGQQTVPAVPLYEDRDISLGLSVVYLEDKDKRLSAPQLIRDFDQFNWQRANDKAVTIGNLDSTFWFSTTIKAPANHRDWFIRISHAGLNLIDSWIILEDQVVAQHQLGSQLPFEQRPFLDSNFVIPVSLQAHQEYQLLFRVSMNGLLDFPLNISSAKPYAEQLSSSNMQLGIYYGIAIIMALYNLVIFIYSRELSYLFYVCFIGSLATFLAIIEGSAFRYLWPNYPQLNDYALPFYAGLTQLFATIFTESFLNIRKHSQRLFTLLLIVGCLNLGAVLSSLLFTTEIAFFISSISGIFTFPLLLFAGSYMWYRGQYYARYFCLSWGLLCFFCLWITIIALGIVPWEINNIWELFRIASTIEMVLLALALAARIDFLSRKEEQSRAESEAKTQFIAQISHELRTPMNGILGMSALLRDHLKDKQSIHFNNVIYQSGLALLGIINDVLDAAKIDADKLETEKIPFSLTNLCEQSLYVIEPQSMVKSLVVTSEIDNSIPPTVIGDPNRIRQVLLNLLSNAAKFTDKGSITLTAKNLGHDSVRITVTDTGSGIDKADLKGLFTPYTQQSSVEQKSKGTGLGLYICKKLVEVMGGTIDFDSTEGQGSSFWFELPLPASDLTPIPLAGQLDEAVISSHKQEKSLTILVAEDNAANQLVINKLLEKMGHQVTIVNNGEEAVHSITDNNKPYDLVLMDCEMPVMDGYEACEKIRQFEQDSQLNAIPIIALTAHAMSEYRERCMQAGMNEVLTKPVRALTLQQTLQRYSKMLEL